MVENLFKITYGNDNYDFKAENVNVKVKLTVAKPPYYKIRLPFRSWYSQCMNFLQVFVETVHLNILAPRYIQWHLTLQIMLLAASIVVLS